MKRKKETKAKEIHKLVGRLSCPAKRVEIHAKVYKRRRKHRQSWDDQAGVPSLSPSSKVYPSRVTQSQ